MNASSIKKPETLGGKDVKNMVSGHKFDNL